MSRQRRQFANDMWPLTATDRAYQLDHIGEPYREVLPAQMSGGEVLRGDGNVKPLGGGTRKFVVGVDNTVSRHAYDTTLLNFDVYVVACQRFAAKPKEISSLYITTNLKLVTCKRCRQRLNL